MQKFIVMLFVSFGLITNSGDLHAAKATELPAVKTMRGQFKTLWQRTFTYGADQRTLEGIDKTSLDAILDVRDEEGTLYHLYKTFLQPVLSGEEVSSATLSSGVGADKTYSKEYQVLHAFYESLHSLILEAKYYLLDASVYAGLELALNDHNLFNRLLVAVVELYHDLPTYAAVREVLGKMLIQANTLLVDRGVPPTSDFGNFGAEEGASYGSMPRGSRAEGSTDGRPVIIHLHGGQVGVVTDKETAVHAYVPSGRVDLHSTATNAHSDEPARYSGLTQARISEVDDSVAMVHDEREMVAVQQADGSWKWVAASALLGLGTSCAWAYASGDLSRVIDCGTGTATAALLSGGVWITGKAVGGLVNLGKGIYSWCSRSKHEKKS